MVRWHHRLDGHELEQLRKLVMDREGWHAVIHGTDWGGNWVLFWWVSHAQYIFESIFCWWAGLCFLPVVGPETKDGGGNGPPSKGPVQAVLGSVPPTLQQATPDPRLCWRLLDTHRQVWVSFLWGHCSFLLGLGKHKILPVSSKSLFLQSCISSVIKSHWPAKSNSPRFSVPLPDPQVGNSVESWNFHNSVRISLVSLFCSFWVICLAALWWGYWWPPSRRLMPQAVWPDLLHKEPLPLWKATADPHLCGGTQTQFWLSLSAVVGFWCAQCFVWALQGSLVGMQFDSKCDFTPPPSFCDFSFALGHGVSFFGGIQHSPVHGCSAVSCYFGVLAEDKHTSLNFIILGSFPSLGDNHSSQNQLLTLRVFLSAFLGCLLKSFASYKRL